MYEYNDVVFVVDGWNHTQLAKKIGYNNKSNATMTDGYIKLLLFAC